MCFFYFRALTVFYGFTKSRFPTIRKFVSWLMVLSQNPPIFTTIWAASFSCEFFQFACKYAVPFIKNMVRADVLSVADQGAEITA